MSPWPCSSGGWQESPLRPRPPRRLLAARTGHDRKASLQSGHTALVTARRWMQAKQKRWNHEATQAPLVTSPRQMGHGLSSDASDCPVCGSLLPLAVTAAPLSSRASSASDPMSCKDRRATCLSFPHTRRREKQRNAKLVVGEE